MNENELKRMRPNTLDSSRLAYAPKELIGLLGVSRATAYKLANKVGVKVGGRLLVPAKTIERILSGEIEVG